MRKLCTLLLCLLVTTSQLLAQTKTVTGKVTDDKGLPIAGATVKEKGTKNGVTAADDGSFAIKIKNEAILYVSAIGFEDKQVKPAGSVVAVQMISDIQSLSEVVVTGVGVATSKKKLAISVESIVTDKTGSTPSASVDQFLVGKVAGAQISSTNGSPGRPVNILLRGINTLNRGTSPMILVDGIEVRATDLSSLDLGAYDRVEVVQGAAAATIYGAQGANGVIQLFTKKGKQGKINIDFASSYASNTILNVGGVQKAKFHAFVTDATNTVLGGNNLPLVFNANASAYTTNVQYNALSLTSFMNKPYDQNLQWYDHYKMFFQEAYSINNSVTISGAKDKIDFNISVSNNKQNSAFKSNGDFERTNFNSNVGIELLKNLKFRSLTQLVYTKNTLNDPTGRGIIFALNNTRPFANLDFKDPDGNYGNYLGDAVGVNSTNPNYTNQYSNSLDNKIDVVQNFNINYKPIKYLELDAKYGLNYQTQDVTYNYLYQGNNKNQINWANPGSRAV
ncbi:MAG: TonB-dependent receptor plug domain-containing protein, partial [Deinococcales bacterium]|nr:TonB-dependent receptor plug domain-containing protein [Chitinophagaceae bacterium]